MTLKRQGLNVPHNNDQQPNSALDQISLTRPKLSVGPPSIWLIHVSNFQYTQIINTTHQGAQQGNRNQSIHVCTQTVPKQSQFSQETLYRWQTLKTQHSHSPGLSLRCRNLIQIGQIPNVLRTRNHVMTSVKRPHNQSPGNHRAYNIQEKMNPKPLSKHGTISTKRQQEQPHVSYTGKGQQTFQICLSQRSQHSNDKTRPPKKPQKIPSKSNRPNLMKSSSPKKQNLYFWKSADHQGNAGPCSHINVCCPHMQGSLRQFPKQTQSNQPQSQHCQQISRFQYGQQFLNRTQIGVSGLAVDQCNTKQKQPTAESPQQKIFHPCFNCVWCTIIHPTQHYNRKTLKFKSQIKSNQIHCITKQMHSQKKQQSQVDIFQMYNVCPFLPGILQKQNYTGLSPQKRNNINPTLISTKQPSRHQTPNCTIPKQINHQNTHSNYPHIQVTLNMQGTRNRFPLKIFCRTQSTGWKLSFWIFVKQKSMILVSSFVTLCNILTKNVYFFGNRIIQRAATIPNQQKQLKKKKSFRSPNNNIQSHSLHHRLLQILCFHSKTMFAP